MLRWTISDLKTKTHRTITGTACQLFVVAGLAVTSVQADERNTVLEAFGAKRDRIQTLYVNYSEELEALVPEKELFETYGHLIFGRSDYAAAFHRDGRLYYRQDSAHESALRILGRSYSTAPFEDVRARLNRTELPSNPVRMVYDGLNFWRHREEYRATNDLDDKCLMFSLVDMSKSTALRNSLIDQFLFDLGDVGSEPATGSGLPLSFDAGRARFLKTEVLGESECLVFDCQMPKPSDLSFRFYFDPTIEYGLRKRQTLKDGVVISDMEASNFDQIVDKVWLPKRLAITSCVFEGNDIGKPLTKSRITARWEANKSKHEDHFRIHIPPGSKVLDQTRRPTDREGRQQKPLGRGTISSVSYTQPEDLSEVDRIVEDATLEQGERLRQYRSRHEPDPEGNSRSWFLWVSLIAMAMIPTVLVLRKIRKDW